MAERMVEASQVRGKNKKKDNPGVGLASKVKPKSFNDLFLSCIF